ncbi:MAG: hypothetical protein ACI9Z3_000549 [Roseivirga sp.]|jgi:hypothetical protein
MPAQYRASLRLLIPLTFTKVFRAIIEILYAELIV